MGYFPKRVKRRRHSWATGLARSLVMLGAQGSHVEFFLCETPRYDPDVRYPAGKLEVLWHSKPRGRVLMKRNYYYLQLPDVAGYDGPTEVQGASQGATTIRGARFMGLV